MTGLFLYDKMEIFKNWEVKLMDKDEEIKELKERISILEKQLSEYKEVLEQYRRMLFVKKTEKTEYVNPLQMNLFNENFEETPNEAKEVIVKSHKKQISRTGKRKLDLSRYPHEEVHHSLEAADCVCDECHEKLQKIASKFVRHEVIVIPEQIKVIDHYQDVYKCQQCRNNFPIKLKKAKMPRSLLSHSPLASPSVIAHIAAMKFFYKLPLYRQEFWGKFHGIDLPRSQTSHWMIKVFAEQCEPLYKYLRKQLMKLRYIHIDETPYNTIESKKNKTFYWVMAAGKHEKRQLAIYYHHDGRDQATAIKLLTGFKGAVQTDGYAAYNFIDKTKHLGCLAHVRRKFVNALEISLMKNSKAVSSRIVQQFDEITFLDNQGAKLKEEARKQRRQEIILPKMKAVFEEIEKMVVAPKTALHRAQQYALNQESRIINTLKEGYYELTNNRAERVVKESVMGRKNWEFSATFEGAKANAVALTLIMTAKLNHLNPETYLYRILKKLTEVDILTDDVLEELMPWNMKSSFSKHELLY
jgi:transposase